MDNTMNQTPPQMPPEEGSNMKWVVIAIVVVVLLIAIGWMFMQNQTPTPVPQQEGAPTAETQVPTTTGNVDDIISTLLSAEVAEALVANGGDNDISLVTSDADVINGMNTLYNDNEF